MKEKNKAILKKVGEGFALVGSVAAIVTLLWAGLTFGEKPETKKCECECKCCQDCECEVEAE